MNTEKTPSLAYVAFSEPSTQAVCRNQVIPFHSKFYVGTHHLNRKTCTNSLRSALSVL